MATRLRGIFLTSDDPAATARFYDEVAGLPIEAIASDSYTYWRVDQDGMQLAIHDAGAFSDYSSPPQSGSNLTHLYFKIEDLPDFLAHLGRQGLSP